MKNILVIEDEIALQKIYKDELSRAGFEVHMALDGKMALKVLREITPDLIILDILLPGEDGLEILAEIKSNTFTEKIPVIIVSNLSNPELIAGAKKMGVVEFFVKVDLKMDDLVKKVTALLSTSN